jgi:hypothetical protein
LACRVSITVAGPNRVLRILVDTRKAKDWELMAAIGHELWHAVEVLGEPNVTTAAAMFFFYHRRASDHIGSRATFETQAAIKVGNAVLAEVRRSAVQE